MTTSSYGKQVQFGFVFGLEVPNLLKHHVEWAREAERVGASLISSGEVPVLTADPYQLLQSIASYATTAKIGTCVSMPGLRHPVVHARTMVTLQALTGGRAFLGLGRGLGGLKLIGDKPVGITHLFEYARAVRSLCAGEKVIYDGHELVLSYDPMPVPIFIAATGPKGLDLAGQYADGVFVGNGATVERVQRAAELVRKGTDAAGRSFEDLETWHVIRVHLARSEQQGIEDMAFYTTRLMFAEWGGAEQALNELEPNLRERVRGYLSEASDDVDSYGFECDANRAILQRYELTEWAAHQFFLTGTQDDIVGGLRRLVDAGAHNFIVPLVLPEFLETTRQIGEIFEVLTNSLR